MFVTVEVSLNKKFNSKPDTTPNEYIFIYKKQINDPLTNMIWKFVKLVSVEAKYWKLVLIYCQF